MRENRRKEEVKMADVENKALLLGQLGNAMTSFADKADGRFSKKADLAAVSSKVDVLAGTDTNKSVRTIANEELTKQLVPEDAKDSLDTLTEIAAWIQEHPGDASALNEAVQALRTKLTLGADPNGEEGAEYATVKAYVEAYVAAQIGGIDNSVFVSKTDLTTALDGKVDKVEGKGLSANDFTDEYKAKLDSLEFATDAEVDAIIAGIWTETAEREQEQKLRSKKGETA